MGDNRSWKRGNLKEDKRGVGKSGSIMEGSFGRQRERERERERVVELYAPHKTSGVQVVGWILNLLV